MFSIIYTEYSLSIHINITSVWMNGMSESVLHVPTRSQLASDAQNVFTLAYKLLSEEEQEGIAAADYLTSR